MLLQRHFGFYSIAFHNVRVDMAHQWWELTTDRIAWDLRGALREYSRSAPRKLSAQSMCQHLRACLHGYGLSDTLIDAKTT